MLIKFQRYLQEGNVQEISDPLILLLIYV